MVPRHVFGSSPASVACLNNFSMTSDKSSMLQRGIASLPMLAPVLAGFSMVKRGVAVAVAVAVFLAIGFFFRFGFCQTGSLPVCDKQIIVQNAPVVKPFSTCN